MRLIDGPQGPLEVLVSGSGEPVTVFAHGLTGSIDETRPFGSDVAGTKVFFHFGGHGRSVGPRSSWTYARVEADLRAVLQHYDACRALGVSLGAGALMRAAARTPDRFERLVFVLPAAIDEARHDRATRQLQAMAGLVAEPHVGSLAQALLDQQPPAARTRPDVTLWANRKARRLADSTVARALRELPTQRPLADRSALAAVTCPALVIGQEEDDAHPAAVAVELAAALPHADLHIYDGQGLVWSHRDELRALISGFLNDLPPR
jgi:3-oxoadipate enol-lactonase